MDKKPIINASSGPTVTKPVKKKVAVKMNLDKMAFDSKSADEKKACRKASKKAGDCVYLLETVLGNMKSIEDNGGNGKFNEISEIYKKIEELNLQIIDL